MTRLSPPSTVFGVGRWPRGRLDVTGVRKVAWGPSPDLLPGCQASWGSLFLPGEAGGHKLFFTAEGQPLFTHPGTSAERATKTPFLTGSALAPVYRETF